MKHIIKFLDYYRDTYGSFKNFPQFKYYNDNGLHYKINEKYEIEITALIDLILSLETEEFVKTPDIRKCGWCEYRSYCQRGNVAQDWEEHPESDLIDDEIKIPGDAVDAWGSV